MRVFISWSGETSKALAEILRGWLPSVLQAVRPYFSPDDITKGSRWPTEIGKELEQCRIGILCLTPDNLEAPWIIFEAGALSKSISSARVCPLLFGVEPTEIKGPLVQFQAAPFAEDEMKKTLRMMNQELGENALPNEVLNDAFEMRWPILEEKVRTTLSVVRTPGKQSTRSERDILGEILAHVRASTVTPVGWAYARFAIKDLVEKYHRLLLELRDIEPGIQCRVIETVESLRMPIEFIARRGGVDLANELGASLDQLQLSINREPVIGESPSGSVKAERTPVNEKPKKRARRRQ